MKTLWIADEFKYDGTQLHSLFAYLKHNTLGESIISWAGPCDVSFEHMVDGEDLLAQSPIRGEKMLHFIVEIFERELFETVLLQRLLADIAGQIVTQETKNQFVLYREGDDLYWEGKKLSISIATRSSMSTMIHFAMNITNRGTPVSTCALEDDFNLKPSAIAERVMTAFVNEWNSSLEAVRKVKPVQ